MMCVFMNNVQYININTHIYIHIHIYIYEGTTNIPTFAASSQAVRAAALIEASQRTMKTSNASGKTMS